MAYNRVNHNFLIKGFLLDDTTDESIEISDYIVQVLIKKSYIKDSFPLFVINLRLTEELRDKMRDDEVRVSLRISYFNVEDSNETETTDTNEHTEIGVYYEGIIRIYDKPFTTSVSKIEEDNDNQSSQIESAPFTYYSLSGIPEDLISKNETCFNVIYRNCTPGDAVINLISQVTDNAYIEEFDNKTEYKNVIVPPLSIVPAINFLDANYFVYAKGANIFFDPKKTYIYSPLSKNHESNIVECEILDPNITTSSDVMLFPRVNEDNDVKITFKTTPNYKTKKYIAEHNLGSHTIFYYYDENFNLVFQRDDSDKGYNKIRYIWTPLYDTTIANLRTSESITLAFSNMNPDILNPLTTVRLISDKYKEAQGDYTISELNIAFASGDNVRYNATITTGLIKK